MADSDAVLVGTTAIVYMGTSGSKHKAEASLTARIVDTSTGDILATLSETEIGLANTHVTDAGVQELAYMCSNLTDIRLNGTRITDTGVLALSHCEHLQKIELRNTRVGDTGVRALAEMCKKLKRIDLNGTQVTVDAMQFMMRELPMLRIYVSRS